MKHRTLPAPSFVEGVVVALVVALAGTLAYSAFSLALAGEEALRLVTAGLGLGYLLYLLGRSPERIGRIVVLVSWGAVTVLLWVLSPTLSIHLLVHLAMICAARSLYFHQRPLAAVADLGLTGVGLIAAVGAYLHTGSLFLSLWSLFLVQALFVFIPPRSSISKADEEENEGFRRAHRAAEEAVQRLSSTR